MTPSRLLRTISIVEACTWALMLLGMNAQSVVAHELGRFLVPFAGAAHGTAFLAYLWFGLVLAAHGRWPWRAVVLGALSSVPPFTTLLFDWWAERRGYLATGWLPEDSPAWRPWPLTERMRGVVPWTLTHSITLTLAIIAAFLFILTPSLGSALNA